MSRRMIILTLSILLMITCFSVAQAQRQLILGGRTSPENPVNNYYFTDDDYAHFGIYLYEDGTFSMSEMHWESVYFHEGTWSFTGNEIILNFSDGAHLLNNSIKIRDGKGYTWFCNEEVEVNLPRNALSFLRGEPDPVQTTMLPNPQPSSSVDDRTAQNDFETEKEIGHIVTFGNYEQDNNLSNGKEPIEWIVLDVLGDKRLLISRYIIDALPYNDVKGDITWEQSSLRRWLNSDFLYAAFTEDEQEHILITEVDNSDEQMYRNEKYYYDSHGGNDTLDQIFLLSDQEAIRYFANPVHSFPIDVFLGTKASIGEVTKYATNQGAKSDVSGSGQYWLRSPGPRQYMASTRSITNGFNYVEYRGCGIRPVLWIRTDGEQNASNTASSSTAHSSPYSLETPNVTAAPIIPIESGWNSAVLTTGGNIKNRITNPGFEEDDLSMWQFTSDPVPDSSYEIYESSEDAHSGSRCFLYQNHDNTLYVMEQTLTNLDPGVYEASVFSQGNNSPSGNGYMYLIVDTDNGSYVDVIHNTEYGDWHQAHIEGIEVNGTTVRIELQIYCEADCWGILDDFSFIRTDREHNASNKASSSAAYSITNYSATPNVTADPEKPIESGRNDFSKNLTDKEQKDSINASSNSYHEHHLVELSSTNELQEATSNHPEATPSSNPEKNTLGTQEQNLVLGIYSYDLTKLKSARERMEMLKSAFSETTFSSSNVPKEWASNTTCWNNWIYYSDWDKYFKNKVKNYSRSYGYKISRTMYDINGSIIAKNNDNDFGGKSLMAYITNKEQAKDENGYAFPEGFAYEVIRLDWYDIQANPMSDYIVTVRRDITYMLNGEKTTYRTAISNTECPAEGKSDSTHHSLLNRGYRLEQCTCGLYGSAAQCLGFAKMIFCMVNGKEPSKTTNVLSLDKEYQSYQYGDYVRSDGHSYIILEGTANQSALNPATGKNENYQGIIVFDSNLNPGEYGLNKTHLIHAA